LSKQKIYLDCCCFNRPFDDAGIDKVRLESEAVLTIIDRGEAGLWDICKSDILLDEMIEMPDKLKLQRVLALYSAAAVNIALCDDIIKRARELSKGGIKAYDALHIASAEYAKADVLLTTDKRLINAAKNAAKIRVLNPLVWLMEVLQ